MEQYKIDFESMQWDGSPTDVRSKSYEQGGRRLRLTEFRKGFVEREWCTKGHIGYILEGKMEIDFGGRTTVLGPGDGFFIPAGEEHKHKGRTVTGLVKIILVEDV